MIVILLNGPEITIRDGRIECKDPWLAETLTALCAEPAPGPSDGDPDWLIAQRVLALMPGEIVQDTGGDDDDEDGQPRVYGTPE